jgi:hypothetical protein
VVFDDHFTTVPFMEKIEVPTDWAQLIEKSCEKVTEEHYELAKTWLFPDPKPGNISLPERNQDVSNNSNGTLIDQETIGHNVSQICALLECSPQFMSAFPVIWTHLEYLSLKIISNTPYCLLYEGPKE